MQFVDYLLSHPDVAVQSRDDAKCKALLAVTGILNDFSKADEPTLSVIGTDNHSTHWVVGACWSGYPTKEGNGYRVFCLPKSKFSQQQVREFIDYAMDTNGGFGRQDKVLVRPAEWRQCN